MRKPSCPCELAYSQLQDDRARGERWQQEACGITDQVIDGWDGKQPKCAVKKKRLRQYLADQQATIDATRQAFSLQDGEEV